MKQLVRECPICGENQGKVYKTIKMCLPWNVELPNEYDVVGCTTCGFIYADEDSDQEAYNNYYRVNNVYSADGA